MEAKRVKGPFTIEPNVFPSNHALLSTLPALRSFVHLFLIIMSFSTSQGYLDSGGSSVTSMSLVI